ncbi:MAG: hypothetical protein DI529_04530 [Chryseobacterium sp.]|nr:MAG: hypothetical protein DI529_04530 [Chryseobacterium sp.]
MKKAITAILTFLSILALSQTIKVTQNYGSTTPEIQELMNFQNIYTEKLNFESKNLKGKSYIINLEEYSDGKIVHTVILFDGTETDYFKIDSTKESLMFFFELSNGKLKTYIRGKKFGSKKSYFKLYDDADKYALKDFFGNNKELNMDSQKKNVVFAIITPTIHKDGSGSYCEVVQSDVKPEDLGSHFKIPHYFLVTISFK